MSPVIAEMVLCQVLSDIELGLVRVLPLLPHRIAKLEAQLDLLPPDMRETCEHMLKIEKIVLFCGRELAALEASKSETIKKVLARGPIQVVSVPPPAGGGI
jgi:hypothetical protein